MRLRLAHRDVRCMPRRVQTIKRLTPKIRRQSSEDGTCLYGIVTVENDRLITEVRDLKRHNQMTRTSIAERSLAAMNHDWGAGDDAGAHFPSRPGEALWPERNSMEELPRRCAKISCLSCGISPMLHSY